MLATAYTLLIGFFTGLALTFAACDHFYRRKLEDAEDHWSTLFNNHHTEWTNFYAAEAKMWQENTAVLIQQTHEDAVKATDDLWRGRKKTEKPKEPSN